MAYQNKKSFISLQTSPPFPVLSFAKIIVHGKISKAKRVIPENHQHKKYGEIQWSASISAVQEIQSIVFIDF